MGLNFEANVGYMSDSSEKPHEALPSEAKNERTLSAKDEAARILSLALQDEHWARVRAQKRTRVVGIHGTDFDNRDARVEHIVEKFNARAVKTARKNALHAGWTKSQLDTFESDAEQGSGIAPA